MLIVNLGDDQVFETVPEPLIAPIEDRSWRLKWSSEHLTYGGTGAPEPVSEGIWRIPGHAAVMLEAGDAEL